MGRKKRRSSQFKDSSTVIDMEQARKERQAKRRKAPPKKKPEERQPTVTNERQDRRRMALRRRKQRRMLLVMGVFLGLVILVGFSVGNIIVLKHDLHVAKKQTVEYQAEKEQLQKDLKQINDLENLEEQARDQMRMVKPGETLYIFPEEMTKQ